VQRALDEGDEACERRAGEREDRVEECVVGGGVGRTDEVVQDELLVAVPEFAVLADRPVTPSPIFQSPSPS
jgi:hypothetical protein